MAIILVAIMALTPMSVNAAQDNEVHELKVNIQQEDMILKDYETLFKKQWGELRIRFSFTDCEIAYTSKYSGVNIAITCGTTLLADTIGITNFELQRKIFGIWYTVAISATSLKIDSDTYMGIITAPAVEGETYRIKVDFIATRGSEDLSRSGETDEFKYVPS